MRFVSLVFLAFTSAQAFATEYTVCADTAVCDESTIAAAYGRCASTGDIVTVTDSRVYQEELSISKSVTIRSTNATPATWDGRDSGGSVPNNSAKIMGGATVIIEGFTMGRAKHRAIEIEASSELTLNDVTFDNYSEMGHDGLAFKVKGTSTVNCNSCTFSNLGGDEGGAIRIEGSSTVNISASTFTSNSADKNGGAISLQSASTVVVQNTTFTSHSVTGGEGVGGTISAEDSTVVLNNVTINTSSALYGGGAIYAEDSDVSITNNSVFGTSSLSDGVGTGGHILMADNDGADNTLSIADSTFSNGSVLATGGSVSVDTVDMDITNATFSDNSANNDGGAVYIVDGDIITFDGVDFTSNDSGDDGGALKINTSNDISITGGTFASNTTADRGGAIDARNSTKLLIESVTFELNDAGSRGGAANIQNVVRLDLDKSTLNENQGSRGGALNLEDIDNLAATRNGFCQNSSGGSNGGAVHLLNPSTGGAIWTNNTFVENTAAGNGGGVYVFDNDVDFTNNHFLTNDSTGAGGALYLDEANYNFVNNLVAWNSGGEALYAVWAGTPSYTTDYNDWYLNVTADVDGDLVAGDLGTNSIYLDPKLTDYTSDGDCTNDKLWPDAALLSPLINAGVPSIFDPNPSGGTPSVSDIGAFGGPGADESLFTDFDGDGYTAIEDCDDDDILVNPGATEVCDALDVDEDCDGDVDDDDASVDTSSQTNWYVDGDEDNYGAGTALLACDDPSDGVTVYSSSDADCNDMDELINPDATEVCDAADVDENCNSVADDADATVEPATLLSWYIDGDVDGYGEEGSTATLACDDPTTGGTIYVDNDGDCDDAVFGVNPDATESPGDEIDQDCDGGELCYVDGDGDGYTDGTTTMVSVDEDCVDGTEATASAPTGDCDDADGTRSPGLTEVCDAADVDEDCDGDADDADASTDASTKTLYFIDGDQDGYGSMADPGTLYCDDPSTGAVWYEATNTDCNDSASSVNPDADEMCDSIDNDCDGTIDGPDSQDAVNWYRDFDGDTFGDATDIQKDCTAPTGYVSDNTDCDDTSNTNYPGADEYCDSVDNDCDDEIDEDDAVDASTWYEDSDGDTYGDLVSTTTACTQPAGYVSDSTDCDDAVTAINPGADEYCDSEDNDCDGTIDEDDAVDATDWYPDLDSDDYGDTAAVVTSCTAPTDHIATGGDCDDGEPLVNPDATEYCDTIDNDCDGTIDEDDAADAKTWYADNDTDTYGDLDVTTLSCNVKAGYVADNTDCDDSEIDINPGADEECDSVDNDCDDEIDEDDAIDALVWYLDDDTDGYGDPGDSTTACAEPTGYVDNDTDCDDTEIAINPDADEQCDGVDNDCDSVTDEDDAIDAATWYEDGDGDTYGLASSTTTACAQPAGYVDRAGDCDDIVGAINPEATELCDGVDNDCDGDTDEDDAFDAITWYLDEDGDEYGDIDETTKACNLPDGYAESEGDCDDDDEFTYPGAPELCDLKDNDCDDEEDEDLVDLTWYRDGDDDGYGTELETLEDCARPDGFVLESGDCDDSDPEIYPGAEEIWYDDVDQDCDGESDFDQDGDGFDLEDECDDTDPEINPDAEEIWYDDIDQDCDGESDFDQDGDGFDLEDDCDDENSEISPGAEEILDNQIDEDCDGRLDWSNTDDRTWSPDEDVLSGTGCSCDVSSAPMLPVTILFGLAGLISVRRRRE